MAGKKLTEKQAGVSLVVMPDKGLFMERAGKLCGPVSLSAAITACRNEDTVRVLGNAQAASLLVSLFDANRGRQSKRIFVGSPGILRDELNAGSPSAVFRRFSLLHVAGSVGGWRRLSETDRNVYLFLTKLACHGGGHSQTNTAFVKHPAYRLCVFLKNINGSQWSALQDLVGHIVDPRWHIDPRNPDRHRRLQFALGLTPATAKRHFDRTIDKTGSGLATDTEEATALSLAFTAFLGDGRQPRASPYDFLQRYYESRIVFRPQHLAWVDTCRLGLQLLVAFWLNEVSRQRLFVPRYLLDKLSDADAVIAACRKSL